MRILRRKQEWEELEKLSKQKRVPLIGYEGFAELCFKAHNKREALKYILKLKEDSKVNYVLRYDRVIVNRCYRVTFRFLRM